MSIFKRRDVIVGLAAAALSGRPAAAQPSEMPTVGFLGAAVEEKKSARFVAFHKALAEAGYTEGRNLAIEYRWAQGQVDRYPALAADLVSRRVSVIASMSGIPSAKAAKAATTTIPIVTQGAFDPVEAQIVASLNRPGGNITGVTNLGVALGPKRLELMRELLPQATIFGLLVNPNHPATEAQLREMRAAADALGLQLRAVNAAAVEDFDRAFASLASLGVKALIVAAGQPFTTRPKELAEVASRYRLPTVADAHEFVAAGGLMTYAGNREEAYGMAGQYVGRILKGEKPADLPIQRASKVELIVNTKAAKALGIQVPLTLLGRADEVIE